MDKKKQTKNTYATHDPAFPYLLGFFLLLTSLAWSLAYANASPANTLRIAFAFVFVHCLLACLLVAAVMYFALPRLLGPKGLLVGRIPLGGRRGGLFTAAAAASEAGGVGEELEFGYCFDVSRGHCAVRRTRGLARSRVLFVGCHTCLPAALGRAVRCAVSAAAAGVFASMVRLRPIQAPRCHRVPIIEQHHITQHTGSPPSCPTRCISPPSSTQRTSRSWATTLCPFSRRRRSCCWPRPCCCTRRSGRSPARPGGTRRRSWPRCCGAPPA